MANPNGVEHIARNCLSRLEEVKAKVLVELEDDFVGLWELVREIRHNFPNADENELYNMTLRLIRDLLSSGQVCAGHPTPDGRDFVPWNLLPEEAVARIAKEWNALGREPNIGDIAWFNAV